MTIDDPELVDEVQRLVRALRIAFAQCAGKPFSFFERAKTETITEFQLPPGLASENTWIELMCLASGYELRTEEEAPFRQEDLNDSQPSEVLRLVLRTLNGVLEVSVDLYARPSGTIEHWNGVYLHPQPSLNLAGGEIARLIGEADETLAAAVSALRKAT